MGWFVKRKDDSVAHFGNRELAEAYAADVHGEVSPCNDCENPAEAPAASPAPEGTPESV